MQSSIMLRIKLEQCASIPVHLNENGIVVDQTCGCKKCGLGMRLSPNLQVIAEKVPLNWGEGKRENEGGGIQWEENEVLNVPSYHI